MLNLKFLWPKKLNRLWHKILNNKITYFILLLIILIQFLLVSIIFLQNKTSKYIIEQANFKAATIESKQNQLMEKLNYLQSNVMRMSSQLQRLQGQGN